MPVLFVPAVADTPPLVKIQGLRPIPADKVEDLAKRLGAPTERTGFLGLGGKKLAKKTLIFIAAWSVYNTARAQGNSHAEAAFIAGLDSMNPLPVGYEEWVAAGNAYGAAMDWALENNIQGGRAGRTPLEKDGMPIHPRLSSGFKLPED